MRAFASTREAQATVDAALDLLRKHGQLSRQKLQDMAGLSPLQGRYVITRLVADGDIERVGDEYRAIELKEQLQRARELPGTLPANFPRLGIFNL